MPQKPNWHFYIPKVYTTFKNGYTLSMLRDDCLAGLTVAIVALPLSMALAIASGVSPDKGLVTAIIAGFLISLLGGSRFQIGGPTGAFVVVVFNVIQQFGYEGLVLATLMAGGILVLAGLLRLGTYIKYIPHPVVTGFTSGIATLIFISQVKDFLGLDIDNIPADFLDKVTLLFLNLQTYDPYVLGTALLSIAIILISQKTLPKYPSFLIAIAGISLLTWIFALPIETIGTKFGGIPSTLSLPHLPVFSWDQAAKLLPSAFTIAFLAGIESLLSAVVADGMTGAKHRSNCELVAQGIANIGSSLFAGIPATGAIARTATNIRSGAHSPVAGMIHSLALLAFVLFFAPLASFIPLSCLSAVLMIVAWNMSEFDKFIHLFKAPIGDRIVLIATFLLTVLVDLNLAIEVGFVLSAVLFMHRMANAVEVETHINIIQDDEDDDSENLSSDDATRLPDGVLSYQFNGPFFFGAAERLIDTLGRTGKTPDIIILQMHDVPFIDATGCSALATFIQKSMHSGVWLIFSGGNSNVLNTLEKMNSLTRKPNIKISDTFTEARILAAEIMRNRTPQFYDI